jgi:hypothetical protein
MARVTLRPTISADLPHVIGEPLPYRIRAITALVDGRVIGVGGIAFPPRGPAIAFVQLAPMSPNEAGAARDDDGATRGVPEARRYPVAFHRAGLMAMELISASGVKRVVATGDAGSNTALRWLKRLGFRPTDNQPIDGKVLFAWSGDGVRLAERHWVSAPDLWLGNPAQSSPATCRSAPPRHR